MSTSNPAATAASAAAEVGRIQTSLDHIGSRPVGSPEALRALARKLDRLGDEAKASTAAVPAAMNDIVFVGRGGDRLRLNAKHMGDAGGPAAADLHDASKSANQDAQKLEDAQGTYDLKKATLTIALSSAKTYAAVTANAAAAAASAVKTP